MQYDHWRSRKTPPPEQRVRSCNGSARVTNTYVGFNVDLLKDVLQDPTIRSATRFGQVELLRRVDNDQRVIVFGNEQFMEIANLNFVSDKVQLKGEEQETHVQDSQQRRNGQPLRRKRSRYRKSRGQILHPPVRSQRSCRNLSR